MKKKLPANVIETILKSGIVTWGLLLVIWGIAAGFYNPDFLPSPYKTWQGFKEITSQNVLWEDIRVSLTRVALGWSRGVLIGIPLGLLIGRFKVLKWLLEPFINFFRFIPAIGFITLFLMWFGVGEESKIVLIMYATIFPVVINTIAGVNAIDPVKYQAAESLGANAFQAFITVTVPGSLPSVFTGIRLGLSGAIISIVGAEMLASNEGIGYLIYTSRMYFRTDWIFVGIVILGLLGFFSDRMLRFAGKKLFCFYGINE